MRKTIIALLIICTLLIPSLLYAQEGQINSAAEAGYRFPGEFEKHDAIWLMWPTYENKIGWPADVVQGRIIEALAPYVKVYLAVNTEEEIAVARAKLKELNIPDGHVTYYVVPHGDIWCRDMGPIYVVNDETKGLAVVDFNFNCWGYEKPTDEYSTMEEKVDRMVAEQFGFPTIKTNIVSEGGNREFNGKGTMMVTEAVELQRNPGMTRDEIEAEFKRVFGVKKVIWLKNGVIEDEYTFNGPIEGPDGEKNVYTVITTGGHIDEYARFVNENTVLLAEVTEEEAAKDELSAENRRRLEENFEILTNETDQDENPLNVVRIPLADPIYDTLAPGDGVYDFIKELEYLDGSTFPVGEEINVVLAGTYNNFLITNGVVLAQKFWRPGRSEIIKEKDAKAKEVLQSLFPDREIIMINAEPVNIGGGGIHCITQQVPATKCCCGECQGNCDCKDESNCNCNCNCNCDDKCKCDGNCNCK